MERRNIILTVIVSLFFTNCNNSKDVDTLDKRSKEIVQIDFEADKNQNRKPKLDFLKNGLNLTSSNGLD